MAQAAKGGESRAVDETWVDESFCIESLTEAAQQSGSQLPVASGLGSPD